MLISLRFRQLLVTVIAVLGAIAVNASSRAEWAYSEFDPWPGEVRMTSDARDSRLFYRRPLKLEPNDGQAWPRLCTLTRTNPGGTVYISSGLDSRIYQLVAHGGERLFFDASHLEKDDVQIRFIRSVRGNPYLYFSTVPTPQNGEPLSDGSIYALHPITRKVDYSIPVAQVDVGRDWWGAFLPDVRSGGFYLASRGELFFVPRDLKSPRSFFKSKHPIRALIEIRDTDLTSYLVYATEDGTVYELDLKNLKQRSLIQLPTKCLSDALPYERPQRAAEERVPVSDVVSKLPRRRQPYPTPTAAAPASSGSAYPEPDFHPTRGSKPVGPSPVPSDPPKGPIQNGSIVGRVVAPGTSYFGQAILLETNGRNIARQAINNKGNFTFTGLAPGKYFVALERTPDEFYRMTPDRQLVDLASGQLKRVEFTLR